MGPFNVKNIQFSNVSQTSECTEINEINVQQFSHINIENKEIAVLKSKIICRLNIFRFRGQL